VCGRFVLASPKEVIAETFALDEVPELAPRYNIAPTELVAAIRVASGRRVLERRRWGLVPAFAREAGGPPLFNARAETLARKPAFRDAFRRRRCLVPADGFYEWSEVSGRRQPFHLRRADGAPFAMAGLYERWRPAEGEALDSCTVITTQANALLAPLHDRMPVIVPAGSWEAWLDPDRRDVEALAPLLVPAPVDGWLAYPVDPRVNRARHDEPGNVEPLFDVAP
jgi:putative SOS response-associated peptidase YedK